MASLGVVQDGGASVGAGETEGTDTATTVSGAVASSWDHPSGGAGALAASAVSSGVASAGAIGGPCREGLAAAMARERALARGGAEATGGRLDCSRGAFGGATIGPGSGASGETWGAAGSRAVSMASAAKTSNGTGAGAKSPRRTSASSTVACRTMDRAAPGRTRGPRLAHRSWRVLVGRGDGVGLRKNVRGGFMPATGWVYVPLPTPAAG
jgi:hypothetical protein